MRVLKCTCSLQKQQETMHLNPRCIKSRYKLTILKDSTYMLVHVAATSWESQTTSWARRSHVTKWQASVVIISTGVDPSNISCYSEDDQSHHSVHREVECAYSLVLDQGRNYVLITKYALENPHLLRTGDPFTATRGAGIKFHRSKSKSTRTSS